MQRQLAAILFADVAGYTRLMDVYEEETHPRLRAIFSEVIEPAIAAEAGRTVKNTGDGFLACFTSVNSAIRAAILILQEVHRREADQPTDRQIAFRMGLHSGDIAIEERDVYGAGVNLAARLQELAEPGSLLISGAVHEQLGSNLTLPTADLGYVQLKNIAKAVRVFEVHLATEKSLLQVHNSALRKALGSESIVTVPGRGNGLVLPVAGSELPHHENRADGKPFIAVLPFANLSGDVEQEYFADGIMEEIITALSRIPAFYVIDRNSSSGYKGKSPEIRQIGRELGARYVLEGSVRKAGCRVRIAGQLIDVITGTYLWANRFEGDVTDIFDLQDKITVSVVAAIEPKIRMAEIERALRKPTESLQAYDLVLRGRWVYQGSRRDRYEETARLYRRAIALDPNYAVAYALLARALWLPIAFQWTEPSEGDLVECVDLARTAISLGQAEPETLGLAAHIIAFPGGELVEGIAVIDRALAQNPNSVDVLAASGMLRAFLGDTVTAFRHLKEAERLSPAGVRVVNKSFGFCLTSFVDGDYAKAADWAAQDLRERSINVEALRYRTAALALLGRLDEAGQMVNRLLAANPEITISRCRRHIEVTMKNPFKRAGVVEAYYEGLRRAGLPE
jgi:TolB-like protein/class 3 adenylate cyclase